MALVWDNTKFQCLWLDRDVKINYRIFMSYIILLHATLQLWQPKKWMTMNFSESYFKKNTTHNIEAGEQTKNKQLGVPQESRILRYFVDSPLLLWFNEVKLAKCEFRQIWTYLCTWKISPADALSKRLDIPTYSIIQYLKVCWKYGEVLMFCMFWISSLSNIELSIFAFMNLVQVIKYEK